MMVKDTSQDYVSVTVVKVTQLKPAFALNAGLPL